MWPFRQQPEIVTADQEEARVKEVFPSEPGYRTAAPAPSAEHTPDPNWRIVKVQNTAPDAMHDKATAFKYILEQRVGNRWKQIDWHFSRKSAHEIYLRKVAPPPAPVPPEVVWDDVNGER